jgi:hypothetical protein
VAAPKGELSVTGTRLARRLCELASALAQEKGERRVIGCRQTYGLNELNDGGDSSVGGQVHGKIMVFVQRDGSHASALAY